MCESKTQRGGRCGRSKHCHEVSAKPGYQNLTNVNPIGGVELYSREDFAARGIELRFLRPLPLEYPQFGRPFVPWLSIIDVLMFNELDTVRAWLDSHYELS